MNNMELQAEGPRCRLRGARSGLGKRRDRRVDQKSHDGSRGQQFVQQLQPLRRYLYVQICHAGHITAGSVKAGDKSNVNRVGPIPKTIGMLAVAAFAVSAEAVPPAATSTET